MVWWKHISEHFFKLLSNRLSKIIHDIFSQLHMSPIWKQFFHLGISPFVAIITFSNDISSLLDFCFPLLSNHINQIELINMSWLQRICDTQHSLNFFFDIIAIFKFRKLLFDVLMNLLDALSVSLELFNPILRNSKHFWFIRLCQESIDLLSIFLLLIKFVDLWIQRVLGVIHNYNKHR